MVSSYIRHLWQHQKMRRERERPREERTKKKGRRKKTLCLSGRLTATVEGE